MDLIAQRGKRAMKVMWVSKGGRVNETRMLLWPQLRPPPSQIAQLRSEEPKPESIRRPVVLANPNPSFVREPSRQLAQLRSEEPRLEPMELVTAVRELFMFSICDEAKLEYLDDEGDWVRLNRADELDAAFLSKPKLRNFLIIVYDQKESVEINRVALRKLFEDSKSPDLAEDGKG